MTTFSRNALLAIVALTITLAVQSTAAAPDPPNPNVAFLGQEPIVTGGKTFIRYYFDITNKEDYAAELFAASPDLPPCGTTKDASRTWVDIYAQNGKRLNGFCNFSKPADLHRIWFALEQDELPPSWIYVELTDRKTNTRYKSNLAETTN